MDLPTALLEETNDIKQRQIALEAGMVDDGIARYRAENYDSTSAFGDKSAGRAIMVEMFAGVSKEIKRLQRIAGKRVETLREQDYDKKFKDKMTPYILQLPADKIAYITMKVCMGTGFGMGSAGILCSTAALAITTELRRQAEVEKWIEESQEDNGRNFARYLLKRSKNFNPRQWNMWKQKLENLPNLTWSHDERVQLGSLLLSVMVEKGLGYFEVITRRQGKRTKSVLVLTEEARAWVEKYNTELEETQPTFLPSLSLPVPFIWDYERHAYMGGYHIIPNKLMTDGFISKHTGELHQPLSDEALNAVNNLMRMPFRVDNDVLGIAKICFETNNGFVDGLVGRESEPLPVRVSDEEWEGWTKEEQTYHKFRTSQIHKRRHSDSSRRSSAILKMNIADRFKDDVFYHIVRLDTRGRAYYVSGEFQPQSDQLGKSCHRFALSVPLGSEGMYWLRIHLANTYGYDKASFDDMQAWVDSHHNEIMSVADDPMTNKFWTEGDEPLMFLQACNEYREAYNATNPEAFMSTIPVYQDGSNNGLQLLSLLGRDPVGARYTNCSSDPNRYDIYNVVADRVKEMLLAGGKQEMIDFWYDRIDRKICKRSAMTKAYGVTLWGIQQQFFDDGFITTDTTQAREKAKYLSRLMDEALTAILSKASDIMTYFQDVADVLAEENLPLDWVAPSGSLLRQRYRKVQKKRVRTILGQFAIYKADESGLLNHKRQINGASPNIIHSIDASILHNVINRLNDGGVTGIISIHDSFGVHAGNVSMLRDVIRESAYDAFKGDWLADFSAFVKENNKKLDFPEPPARADFDVSEVLQSNYFFA